MNLLYLLLLVTDSRPAVSLVFGRYSRQRERNLHRKEVFDAAEAREKQLYPHVTSILYKNNHTVVGCGTILTQLMILSHNAIFKDGDIDMPEKEVRDKFYVACGMNKMNKDGLEWAYKTHINGIHRYKYYNNPVDEVVLLRLEKPLTFSITIEPVKIAPSELYKNNSIDLPQIFKKFCALTTWGADGKLKTFDMKLMKSKECSVIFGNIITNSTMNHICGKYIGSHTHGKRDHGCPLMCDDWQVGLISGQYHKEISLFVRVDAFSIWFDVMKNNTIVINNLKSNQITYQKFMWQYPIFISTLHMIQIM